MARHFHGMRISLLLITNCLVLASPAFAVDRPVNTPPAKGPTIEAMPKSNPGTWVTPQDYPDWALRANVEGVVHFRLTVNEDGKAIDCQITKSTGVPDLDAAACANLLKRADFVPAYDADGNATTSTWDNSVRWQIPHQDRPSPKEGYLVASMIIEEDGTVSSCEIERAEGEAATRPPMCTEGTRFSPVLDENGIPQRRKIRIMVRVIHEDIAQ